MNLVDPSSMSASDELRSLLACYCDRIDAGDFAGVGALFAHGALLGPDGTELARGVDGVAAFYATGTKLHGGTPRTKHLVTNVDLDLDEPSGRARARSSYLVLQQVGDGPLQPIITGRYRDAFERGDDGWHFVERQFFVDLMGDLSQHLAYRIP